MLFLVLFVFYFKLRKLKLEYLSQGAVGALAVHSRDGGLGGSALRRVAARFWYLLAAEGWWSGAQHLKLYLCQVCLFFQFVFLTLRIWVREQTRKCHIYIYLQMGTCMVGAIGALQRIGFELGVACVRCGVSGARPLARCACNSHTENKQQHRNIII